MRCRLALAFMLGVISPALAQEKTAATRIVGVDLFKNGLAVVKRKVEVPGPGTFRLDTMPNAVHGSLWFTGNAPLEGQVQWQETDEPAVPGSDGELHEALHGKKVTVHLRDGKSGPLTGVVHRPARPPLGLDAAEARPTDFLILRTDKGTAFVRTSEIATLDVTGEVKAKRPVLLLTVGKSDKAPEIYVSYLATGMLWAPSYRLDLAGEKKLNVEMSAVVRNEMEEFNGAEMRLITGFSSIELASAKSPLDLRHPLFSYLHGAAIDASGGWNFNVAANTMRLGRLDIGAAPFGGKDEEAKGVDLHFRSIGKKDMKAGQASYVALGKEAGVYERVIEWIVTRGAGEIGTREAGIEDIWDVLVFKNPFTFPMTAAPVHIVEGDRFNAQRATIWAAPGQEQKVRITRALNLRTASQEDLDKSKAIERVAVGRKDYSRLHIKGELRLINQRKEVVKTRVLYSLSGQITEAGGEPHIHMKAGSLTDVNPVHDIMWTVTLNPGEEKKLSYGYSTLLDR